MTCFSPVGVRWLMVLSISWSSWLVSRRVAHCLTRLSFNIFHHELIGLFGLAHRPYCKTNIADSSWLGRVCGRQINNIVIPTISKQHKTLEVRCDGFKGLTLLYCTLLHRTVPTNPRSRTRSSQVLGLSSITCSAVVSSHKKREGWYIHVRTTKTQNSMLSLPYFAHRTRELLIMC